MVSFSVFVCVVVGSWLENAGGTVKNKNRVQKTFNQLSILLSRCLISVLIIWLPRSVRPAR